MRFLFGCYVTSLHLQVKRISTHSTQRKEKEEKDAVNLVLLTQKQEARST